MTLTPIEPYASDSNLLTALCVWREARGEKYEGKLGVVWTLRNRCKAAPAQGWKHDMAGNILKPWQFSSFNADDPNSQKYPVDGTPDWLDCLKAAADESPDPTNGATFYFSRPLHEAPKVWGNVVITAVIGGLTFCGFAEVVT